jgi:poly(3-hydroxyalkanoate) synthetase
VALLIRRRSRSGHLDGAYLVENFESLNPANTFWDKYYHLYANVDTEAPRFLEFERWWGGFFLMNREEIEWITRNLFLGNKLWKGGTSAGSGTLDSVRDALNKWYAAHPDQLQRPVIETIWFEMVVPGLQKPK